MYKLSRLKDLFNSRYNRKSIKNLSEVLGIGDKKAYDLYKTNNIIRNGIYQYLIEHGILLNHTAVPFIEFLKRNTAIKNRQSPETPDQVNYILRWNQ